MEDRGVRRQLEKLTHEEPDNVGSANLDRGQRPERSEHERSEHDRMRDFVHELYEELLNLAVAARSILHWPRPPANEIAQENPVKGLDRNGTTTEDEARRTRFDKTLPDSVPGTDPPSTIPDPPELGGQRMASDASQRRPKNKRDAKYRQQAK